LGLTPMAMPDDFEVVGKITNTKTLAVGKNIRELRTLQARFGRGRWRKLKGVASVSLSDGTIRLPKYTGMRLMALVR